MRLGFELLKVLAYAIAVISKPRVTFGIRRLETFSLIILATFGFESKAYEIIRISNI